MYTHKMVNGERVLLTENEIEELNARDDAWAARKSAAAATPEQKLARMAAREGMTVAELKAALR